jgi:Nif-specific regulatory protein
VPLNAQSREVAIEASARAIEAGKAVRYRVGEGITGEVIRTGNPMVVPQVSREARFLFRAAARPELADQELTYISVPIGIDGQTVGGSRILYDNPDRDYERTAKFLGVVGR